MMPNITSGRDKKLQVANSSVYKTCHKKDFTNKYLESKNKNDAVLLQVSERPYEHIFFLS